MSRKIKFYLTDVFGNNKYRGNQLATLVNCGFLSDEEMQQIAREINFSETTFILKDQIINGGYDVRIFTPGAEVDFAGHPTLGTAFIINNMIAPGKSASVTLNLKVGQIKVSFTDDIIWMKQIEPVFNDGPDHSYMAKLLSLEINDIDERFPIQQVSTGLPFTIIPLKNIGALKRCKVDLSLYEDFCSRVEAKGILVFSPEAYEKEQDLSVRVFVDYLGIPEDPATGSGNGCLAGYLVKNRYFDKSEINIVTGQGYEINRPSHIYLKAGGTGSININVGGKVIKIAEGEWE